MPRPAKKATVVATASDSAEKPAAGQVGQPTRTGSATETGSDSAGAEGLVAHQETNRRHTCAVKHDARVTGPGGVTISEVRSHPLWT